MFMELNVTMITVKKNRFLYTHISETRIKQEARIAAEYKFIRKENKI